MCDRLHSGARKRNFTQALFFVKWPGPGGALSSTGTADRLADVLRSPRPRNFLKAIVNAEYREPDETVEWALVTIEQSPNRPLPIVTRRKHKLHRNYTSEGRDPGEGGRKHE